MRETLSRVLFKLVLRADGDQAKMACVKIQFCVFLKISIEGATHYVRH